MGCGGDPKATGNTNLSKELDSRGNNIFSILGSSSGYLGFNCRKVDNIVDLKLGSLIPNNNSTCWRGFPVHNSQMQPYSTSTTSSSSGGGGPSRRSRASGGGTQVASCLVDGCKSDLSKCRDYHRRHKVCELHSKTPRVTISGMEQRFCQQCSRFHSLGEFDEGKRSCRKRLEGHNRRRRKPQPDALSVNPANFLSTGRGGRFLPFSSSPIIPAGSVVSSAAWSARPMKPESSSTTLYNTSHSQLNMYDGGNRCYNTNAYRGRQFPFLQGPDSSSSTPSTPNNITVSGGDHGNHGRVHHNLFCENNNNNNNGLSGAQVIDSTDRALSLLSSSSSHAENAAAAAASAHTGIGLSRLIHPIDPHHQVHHHHHHHHHHLTSASLNYNGMGHFPCSSPSSQVLDVAHHHSHGQGVGGSGPDPGTAAGLNMSNTGFHCHDIFQAASEGSASSASGPHQTLSFSWE